MMVKWPDLMAEFDRWEEAGKIATLWWRDDDAVRPTARLGRLLSIASGVPVSLAVIPADAQQELAQWLAQYRRSAPEASVAVLQHGWRHLNHSGGEKKSEFPAGRPRPEVASELASGRARLSDLFGTRAQPVLVPPWHRFRSGGEKKSEFPAGRPRPEVASELASGRARLSDLFGTRAQPVLVPPWNRF